MAIYANNNKVATFSSQDMFAFSDASRNHWKYRSIKRLHNILQYTNGIGIDDNLNPSKRTVMVIFLQLMHHRGIMESTISTGANTANFDVPYDRMVIDPCSWNFYLNTGSSLMWQEK